MSGKTYYWRVKEWGQGFAVIEFWTKPDRSNALTERFVRWEKEHITKRIEMVTGAKNVQLEFVKK